MPSAPPGLLTGSLIELLTGIQSHPKVLQAKFMFRTTDWLHYPEQMQNDQDDCNNDQNMDPTAGFREARTDSPPEKSEQPKDE
jgi:hypothetical protein